MIDVVDTAPLFCDDEHCLAMRDGVMLYDDDDHLSFAGELPIAKAISHLIQLRTHQQ